MSEKLSKRRPSSDQRIPCLPERWRPGRRLTVRTGVLRKLSSHTRNRMHGPARSLDSRSRQTYEKNRLERKCCSFFFSLSLSLSISLSPSNSLSQSLSIALSLYVNTSVSLSHCLYLSLSLSLSRSASLSHPLPLFTGTRQRVCMV